MSDRPGEGSAQPNEEFGAKPFDPSLFEVPEPGTPGKSTPPPHPTDDLPTQYLPGYHPTFPLPVQRPQADEPDAHGQAPDHAPGHAPAEVPAEAPGEVPDWAKLPPLPPIGEPTFAEPHPTVAFGMPEFGLPQQPLPTAPLPMAEFGPPPEAGWSGAGSIERQEPGVTQPRPPTVAEARARDKARKQAQADADAAAAAAAKRRRRMRGGAAVAGVAAVIGAGYLIYDHTAGRDTVAQCTEQRNGQPVVVSDSYCGGHAGPGGFFYFGGHQYRYYYGGGGGGGVGTIARGGSFSAPSSGSIHTRSGSVVRGGFGSGHGSHGSGS